MDKRIRKNILAISILCGCCFTFGQDDQDLEIVRADSMWSKEIISFPIDWAPNLTIDGFEELRFSPEWDQADSPQFWTLALSWSLSTKTALTLDGIVFNLEHYFDGLMKPNHWSTEFVAPELTLELVENENNEMSYEGYMNFFDGFHTGKPITTYINATQWFCQATQRTTVVFQISTQVKSHVIWDTLNAIVPIDTECPK